MMEERNDEIEIDLRDLFYVMLRKIWVIILATALGFGIAAGYTKASAKPTYSSTSTIYVMKKSTGITSLTGSQVDISHIEDYLEFVKSRSVVDKVIENLELDMSYEQLVSNVAVENPKDTSIIYITVKHHDANMAKIVVDKLTDVLVERMGLIIENEELIVADYGNVPKYQMGADVTGNSLKGAVLGFVLSAGMIVLLYLLNDAINTPEDVERHLGINTLGLIPLEEGVSKKGTRGCDKGAIGLREENEKKVNG